MVGVSVVGVAVGKRVKVGVGTVGVKVGSLVGVMVDMGIVGVWVG